MQTITPTHPEGPPNTGGPIAWFQKFMAIIVVINLLLVAFDYS